MKDTVQIIETGDGSHSLLNIALNETYHSRHGALRESEHVFIRHGWQAWMAKHSTSTASRLLEVGLGTGLNAILTLREALLLPSVSFHYTTLEPYPLSIDTVSSLNYPSLLNDAALEDYFLAIHQAPWETDQSLLANFTLHKMRSTLESFSASSATYDLIYFDAFAPNKQAELWELPILQKVVELMAPGAIFVTYSAKGQLKRDLKAIGLVVETLDGPPGKAEMVRARKP